MKRNFALCVVIATLGIFIFSAAAWAGPATDVLKDTVNKVLDILRDPKLKPEAAKEAKKEKLRIIYEKMFDELELSRRALARNWNNLSVAQRKEFVPLFRQILEKAYADKILDYTDEKITFDRENVLADNQVEVLTRVITKSKEVPITYRMIQKEGAWKVYDVVVENVSLVQNYRTQFNEILAKNSSEHLLETLRKKVKEQ